jgi:hypothetical protein
VQRFGTRSSRDTAATEHYQPGALGGAVGGFGQPRKLPSAFQALAGLRATCTIVLALVLGNGCHRPARVEPLATVQTYCWWASQYVTAAPALLVSQFQEGLIAAGFTNAHWQRSPDSAWAVAGPTALPNSPPGATYAFRVVAYAASDSTRCAWRGMPDATVIRRPVGAESCFHTALFIIAPRNGWTQADSVAARKRDLPVCGTVYASALAGLELLK